MILINGAESSELAVTDRGLHYGDGLFETLAVTDGVPELWDRHLARLQQGCQRLHLPMPESDLLTAEVQQVCAGATCAVLKLVLTRGSGGRGYRPPSNPQITRIMSLHPWPDYPVSWYTQGVRLGVCQQRVSLNPDLAGIKHLNRLDQVLARAEWDRPDQAEGLMLDPAGRVIEGTMSNLFVVQDGRLLTPDVTQAGIAGVMRGLILDQAQTLGISCGIIDLELSDLSHTQEMFMCNSVIGIWPVQQLQEWMKYSVIGPQTTRLVAAVEQARKT